MTEEQTGGELRISRPRSGLQPRVRRRLVEELEACPDLAFAHLNEVEVVERAEGAGLVLFAWLLPQAVRSLRSALNLVSEAVARALPEEVYLDVVILNSAPELLLEIEAAGSLLLERDPDERARALEAARAAPHHEEAPADRPWWRLW